ncbi:MAG: tetraacyldisaccharide 4'-kinase [Bacteroidota bacterium]
MKALLPISLVYGLIVWLRDLAFDTGVLKSRNAGVPVISVGNLTVGGTGKTPLVEYIVGKLSRRDRRVAVVSRGYKRTSRGVVVVSDGAGTLVDSASGGDEPVQVARKFPQAIVVVGEKKVDAARVAVDEFKAGIVVMDDGFQHRYLQRDLDIVVVDARTDVTTEPLLPAGRKREPLSALKRAHVVVVSHVGNHASAAEWETKLSPWYQGAIVGFRHEVESIGTASSSVFRSLDEYAGRKVLAFSGIGNPKGFIDTLGSLGMKVVGNKPFPDHHIFTSGDMEEILSESRLCEAEACVTTEKDFIRLQSTPELLDRLNAKCPVWYVKIKASFIFGEQEFVRMLESVVGGKVV